MSADRRALRSVPIASLRDLLAEQEDALLHALIETRRVRSTLSQLASSLHAQDADKEALAVNRRKGDNDVPP